jgi:hypothetical protein
MWSFDAYRGWGAERKGFKGCFIDFAFPGSDLIYYNDTRVHCSGTVDIRTGYVIKQISCAF